MNSKEETMGNKKLYYNKETELKLNSRLSVVVNPEECEKFRQEYIKYGVNVLIGKSNIEKPVLEYKIILDGKEYVAKYTKNDSYNSAEEQIDEMKAKLTDSSENLIIEPTCEYKVFPLSVGPYPNEDNEEPFIKFYFIKM